MRVEAEETRATFIWMCVSGFIEEIQKCQVHFQEFQQKVVRGPQVSDKPTGFLACLGIFFIR